MVKVILYPDSTWQVDFDRRIPTDERNMIYKTLTHDFKFARRDPREMRHLLAYFYGAWRSREHESGGAKAFLFDGLWNTEVETTIPDEVIEDDDPDFHDDDQDEEQHHNYYQQTVTKVRKEQEGVADCGATTSLMGDRTLELWRRRYQQLGFDPDRCNHKGRRGS